MIWVYILAALFFIGLVGYIVLWYFKRHLSALGGMCIGLIAMMTTVLLVIGINQLNSDAANKANLEEYNQLILYYDVVNESNDELLRWDYHNKCQKWNTKYEDWLIGCQSPWCSAFYGRYDFDGCDFIRLELRRE